MALDYCYETLTRLDRDTIRLLTIQPGKTELIECTLTPACLSDSKVHFKALSYMWGT